jgi:hypothetical protein
MANARSWVPWRRANVRNPDVAQIATDNENNGRLDTGFFEKDESNGGYGVIQEFFAAFSQ